MNPIDVSFVKDGDIVSTVLSSRSGRFFTPMKVGEGLYSVRLCFKSGNVLPVPRYRLTATRSSVDDSQVRAEADRRLRNVEMSFRLVQDAAQDGDAVEIEGTIAAISGAEREPVPFHSTIILGEAYAWEGLQQLVLGARAGGFIEGDHSFPEDLADWIIWKKVHIRATVRKCFRLQRSEPVTSLREDEVYSEVAKRLEMTSKRETREQLNRQLLDFLDRDQKLDVPEAIIEKEFGNLRAAQLGEFAERFWIPHEIIQSEDNVVWSELRRLARRRAKTGVVIASLAAVNNILLTASELDMAISSKVYGDGKRRQFSEAARLEEVGPSLEDKVTDWIFRRCQLEINEATNGEPSISN